MAAPLPGSADPRPVPYFMIADDAFMMGPNLMKPYLGRQSFKGEGHWNRIFNYRYRRVGYKMDRDTTWATLFAAA